MKLREIIDGAASVAGFIHPGIAAAIKAVNLLLPDDKKLPETATGADVKSAIESLPPEQQATIYEKEIDLSIKQEEGWTDRYKAMCAADGQTTRPKIALMMAQVLCFEIMAFTVWCFWFPEQMANPVLWTVFASLTATPAALLAKYFGELRKEQANRLSVQQPSVFSALAKLVKG